MDLPNDELDGEYPFVAPLDSYQFESHLFGNDGSDSPGPSLQPL